MTTGVIKARSHHCHSGVARTSWAAKEVRNYYFSMYHANSRSNEESTVMCRESVDRTFLTVDV